MDTPSNIQNSGKVGGDAMMTGTGIQSMSQSGDAGSMTGAGTGEGGGEAGAFAGAFSDAFSGGNALVGIGGDATDNTMIGTININS